jgi:DNA repair protein RecN (Recombination protein N)
LISYINIKNIALIRELTLELKNGLNVLSGETGAGKSIIIDSINFVLGDRADRSLIRHGETTARVEVVFDNIKDKTELIATLDEYGIEYDDDMLVVNRLMTTDKSECRINGHIVNLVILRNIVSLLVDIHSQNEHQSLLKINNHIKLLDNYNSNLAKDKEQFAGILAQYKEVSNKINNFSTQAERERKIDLLSYQVQEIERVNVQENEEEELNNQRNKFYNSQKIFTSLNSTLQNIEGYENMGGVQNIKLSYKELSDITKYDSDLEPILERLDSAIIELDDIADTIRGKLEDTESGNIDINHIEHRINEIKSVKRKYGKDIEDINSFLSKAKDELDELLTAESTISKLDVIKIDLESKLITLANKLHNERVKSADKFSKAICANLRELGMKNSVFEVKIELYDNILANMNNYGADMVEFMLSPNLGEPLKPLAKIASGGEMSRFMLALKNVIAEIDEIDTLIFDEIDTGISGAIAKVVAMKLNDIANNRQVIAITHLPQLASMADVNYLIEKKVEDGKTLTYVNELTDESIYIELMRLAGSVENSVVGLSSAKELKHWAISYKASKLK